MIFPTASGAMADSPQWKARSVLAVGMDHSSSLPAVARASAASSDRNQVTPSACRVCRAQVPMAAPVVRG